MSGLILKYLIESGMPPYVASLLSEAIHQAIDADPYGIKARMNAAENSLSLVADRLVALEAAVVAINVRIDGVVADLSSGLVTLESEISDLSDRIANLESDDITVDGRLDSLETASSLMEGRLDNIDDDLVALDGRLDVIEPIVTSHTASLAANATILSSHTTSIATNVTNIAANTTSISSLNTKVICTTNGSAGSFDSSNNSWVSNGSSGNRILVYYKRWLNSASGTSQGYLTTASVLLLANGSPPVQTINLANATAAQFTARIPTGYRPCGPTTDNWGSGDEPNHTAIFSVLVDSIQYEIIMLLKSNGDILLSFVNKGTIDFVTDGVGTQPLGLRGKQVGAYAFPNGGVWWLGSTTYLAL